MTGAGLDGLVFDFLLVLARLSGLLLFVPGLGDVTVPMPVRAALAAVLAVLVLSAVRPMLPLWPGTPWLVARDVAVELLIGAWLGLIARLVADALAMAGQIMSYMIGLSNVLVPERAGGGQTGVLAQIYGLVPPLLLFSTGLYIVPLSGIVASYRLLPAGGGLAAPDALAVLVRAATAGFALAVRLALPFLLAHTLWQILVGAAGRLAPALQLPMLAFPGQLLGGLLLLWLAAPSLIHVWFAALPGFLAPVGF